jgi:hypothetical protein
VRMSSLMTDSRRPSGGVLFVSACDSSTRRMGGGRRSRKLGKVNGARGMKWWVGMIFINSMRCGKGGIMDTVRYLGETGNHVPQGGWLCRR